MVDSKSPTSALKPVLLKDLQNILTVYDVAHRVAKHRRILGSALFLHHLLIDLLVLISSILA